MKKNGFTLMELLAVIAVLAVLATLVIPNVFKSYNDSLIKKMAIEEKNLQDASDIYLEEHCISPLYYGGVRYTCPSTYDNYTKVGFICLSELQHPVSFVGTLSENDQNDSYIGEIKFKDTLCTGYVSYTKDGKVTIKKAYLDCGSEYQTAGYTSGACN